MNRHQDLRFTTTRGQTLEQSLLMYPMEVVALLLLLLLLLLLAAIRGRSKVCLAQEPAICLYSRATTQLPSTNIRSTCHSLQMLPTTSWQRKACILTWRLLLSLVSSNRWGRISQILQGKAQLTKQVRLEQRWELVLSVWEAKLCNEWAEQLETVQYARLTGKMGISGKQRTQ